MAHPEYYYYAAMFFVALPVAWIAKSKASALVFIVWAIGQALWLIGLPEPQTQLVIYTVALIAGWWLATSGPGMFASILFFPLALTTLCEWTGGLSPQEAWWTIYWIALTQVMSLPFHPELRSAVKRWRNQSKEGGGMGMLRTIYE